MAFIEHEFYCINCGNKGLPIQRKVENQKEKFHRKRLYCIHCQQVYNMVECRNEDEVKEFKEDFAKGAYLDEAKEFVDINRDSWVWKDNLVKKAGKRKCKNRIQRRHSI